MHEHNVAADLYAMSSQERSKYESIFPMYDSDKDGFMTGVEAVDLFSKSRLPREVSYLIPRTIAFSLIFQRSVIVVSTCVACYIVSTLGAVPHV